MRKIQTAAPSPIEPDAIRPVGQGRMRRRAVPAALFIATLAWAGAAAAESEWESLAVHDEIRLMRHTNGATGKESCWIRAAFRSSGNQLYLLSIGFADDGRFRFFLRFTDRNVWLETSGHVLSLANGRRYALTQMEMGSAGGEGLSLPEPYDQDSVVRALIKNGGFALTYSTLNGVRRSRGDIAGLRVVVETAARRCEDARHVTLP